MSCFWTSLLKAQQDCTDEPAGLNDFESPNYGIGSAGGSLVRVENWLADSENLIETVIDSWEAGDGGSKNAMSVTTIYTAGTDDILWNNPGAPAITFRYTPTGYGPGETDVDFRVLFFDPFSFNGAVQWAEAGIDWGTYDVDVTFFDDHETEVGAARGRVTFAEGS